MRDLDSKPALSASARNMLQRVGAHEERMLRRRPAAGPGFWRAVALMGAIGWAVAVPTLIGVAVGAWLDRRWPSPFSWTLTLLFAGLVLGCRDAWTRIKREQEDR